MSIRDIRKLTIHQLVAIYGHETDDKTGELIPRFAGKKKKQLSAKEIFVARWELRGLRRSLIEVKWRETLEEQKFSGPGGTLETEIAAWKQQQEFMLLQEMEAANVPPPERVRRVAELQEKLYWEGAERFRDRLSEFRAEQVRRRK